MLFDRGCRRSPRSLVGCCALVLGMSTFVAQRVDAGAAPERPLRVLLVGNSYTRFNVLPRLLSRLSETEGGTPVLQVDAEAHGGRTLRAHWRAGRALSLIRTGHYSHVVLQDHSLRPVDRPDEFAEYLERFKHAIDASSARTVLYATWPRHPSARLYRDHAFLRSFGQMAEQVDSAYRGAAERLSAQLAPVGPAFERALAEHPELALYRRDATHPSMAGSFLAACVLYGTLTGNDPQAASYVPWELPAHEAALIKRIAAETLGAQARPALPRIALDAAQPLETSAQAEPIVCGE